MVSILSKSMMNVSIDGFVQEMLMAEIPTPCDGK